MHNVINITCAIILLWYKDGSNTARYRIPCVSDSNNIFSDYLSSGLLAAYTTARVCRPFVQVLFALPSSRPTEYSVAFERKVEHTDRVEYTIMFDSFF